MNINNLLFIENDTFWMQQVFNTFKQENIKIEHVPNLMAAMPIITTGSNLYHGVIININCVNPSADLSKLVEDIRIKAPFIKILFTLDNNDPYKIVSISQTDANGYLIKPYSLENVLCEMNKKGFGIKPNFQKPQQNIEDIKITGLSDIGIPNGAVDSNIGRDDDMNFGRNKQENSNGMNMPNQQMPNGMGMGGQQMPNGMGMGGQQMGGQQMPNGMGMNGQQMGGQQMPNGMGMNGQQMGGQQMPNGMGMNGQQGVFRIPRNTTMAVHCPKGGVGKSSISKELSITYALSQLNGEKLKVCLVDMDIDYGDIAVMLEMKQTKSISDWARNIRQRVSQFGENEVNYTYEEIDKFYLLTHKSGLKILAAPTNHRDSALINEDMVKIIIGNLKKMFDVVIIDTGNNVKDFTVTSMELSDRILMIGNTDVSTINELLTLKKTLEQIQFPLHKTSLLMNSVKKGEETQAQQIATYLGFPLIGKLPKISAIEQANNNGEAISMNAQDNMFTVELKRIANSIIPVVKKPNVHGKSPRSSNKQEGLFSKLFGRKK